MISTRSWAQDAGASATTAPLRSGTPRAAAGARPPLTPVPATVTRPTCSYGGAVPAINVEFDVEATAPVTNLQFATLYLRARNGRSWSAIRGAASVWVASVTATGADTNGARLFNGQLQPGQRVRLRVFGQLETAAFGRANYPDAELPFELALTAGASVLRVSGPRCTITPAG